MLKKLGFLVNHLPVQEADSFEDYRLRTKRHLLKESRKDNNYRESARESASISASAKRDANQEGREL